MEQVEGPGEGEEIAGPVADGSVEDEALGAEGADELDGLFGGEVLGVEGEACPVAQTTDGADGRADGAVDENAVRGEFRPFEDGEQAPGDGDAVPVWAGDERGQVEAAGQGELSEEGFFFRLAATLEAEQSERRDSASFEVGGEFFEDVGKAATREDGGVDTERDPGGEAGPLEARDFVGQQVVPGGEVGFRKGGVNGGV